jgi:hypothetical protein
VSLTLGKVTTSAVDVTVSRDNDAMRASINTFVSSYNDLVKLLRDQTKYDNSKAAGLQVTAPQSSRAGAPGHERRHHCQQRVRTVDIGPARPTAPEGHWNSSTPRWAMSTSCRSSSPRPTTPRQRRRAGVRKLMDSLLGSDRSISSRQDRLRRLNRQRRPPAGAGGPRVGCRKAASRAVPGAGHQHGAPELPAELRLATDPEVVAAHGLRPCVCMYPRACD